MSDQQTPQQPPPFAPVNLSHRDLTLLSHSVGCARALGRPIDSVALRVLNRAFFGEPSTADEAAHAVEWAQDYEARLHPPF